MCVCTQKWHVQAHTSRLALHGVDVCYSSCEELVQSNCRLSFICTPMLQRVTSLSSSNESADAVNSGNEQVQTRCSAVASARSPHHIDDSRATVYKLVMGNCTCVLQHIVRQTRLGLKVGHRTTCFASYQSDEMVIKISKHRAAWKGMHKLDQDRLVSWPESDWCLQCGFSL